MMNNCVQLLEKADNLKKELTLTRRNGLNGDGEATSNRAALQDLYRQILITNLEYALDKKIEQELWNFVFKNHITALQQQTKDKSNPKRTEVQNQLTIFLEASSGFYAMLLQDLCHAFKINLPCRVHPAKLALLKDSENIKRSSITQPERPSCQYMCQHCLVHLGDIARYRNQNGQAESYYRHAAQLVPSNGQPYNQLAILAAAGGDILSTAFYYCRSLAVKCPFPGSGTNLQRQLTKIIDGEEPRHQKISTSELIKFYLKFHACIYLRKYDAKLDGIVKRLLGYMHSHLRTGSLSKKQLIHMAFLNLFSLNHLSHGGGGTELGGKSPVHNDSPANENGIDDEDGAPWNILVSFTVRMLGAFLACVPTYSDDTEDLEHLVLPATKLLLDWFCENDALLRNERISLYASVWQRLAKVLNALGNQDKANNMEFQPLPEDLEVRGFIGLRQSLSKLDFVGGYESVVQKEMQHPCRCYRLYQLGLIVAKTSNGLLTTNEQSDGTVFACPLPDDGPSDTDEEEMAILEKMESVHPPKVLESNKPPRIQKDTGTTSILVSSDRSSSGKKDSKKDRPRAVKVNNDNTADFKLKSIQEEGSSQHDDHARSSTASSLDSTSSSPSNLDPPAHHKSSHHVTFAPMPSRHSASPEHVSNYSRRSPSPEFHQHSPDDDYPNPIASYPPPSQDPRVVPHGPIHPLQQIGVYQQQQQQRNYPYPGQVSGVPPPTHVRYPVHGITPHPGIPPSTALRGNHVRGPNPPPNPNELPKPLFPTQRMPFGPDGHIDDPSNIYKTRVGEGSSASLARLAQLQQQQQQMAHQAFVTRAQVRPQIPTALGLAARFSGQPGMRFPPNLQQIKVPPPQVDPIRNSDPHLEALWNQQRKAALQQQQRNQMGPYRYPDANLPTPPGPDNPNIQPMGMHNRNPANPGQDLPGFLYGQVPRNIYPMGRGPGHASSPAGSNNTSSTSSPTPVGGMGPVTSNTSPQAGSLPNQRGPSARFPEGFEGQGLNHPSLIHMIAAQQQKIGQQGFAKSPTQQKPSSVFGQERPVDIFRNKSEAANVPPTRPSTILPSDIFGMSPNSGGMAAFGMSPANSSPSDQFPPYPLSQERQQDTLEMLENTVTNPSAIQQHQRVPEVSANDLLSKAERKQSGQRKQFAGLLGKDENESYQLFPDTDPSWSLGRNSDNNNSLGLSNLGSIGSERAMAQQINNQLPPDRFLWGTGLTSQGKSAPQQRPEQQPGIQSGNNRFGGREYQAFWPSSMLPAGPSTLEQLIRQQQQHAGHDKTPP